MATLVVDLIRDGGLSINFFLSISVLRYQGNKLGDYLSYFFFDDE